MALRIQKNGPPLFRAAGVSHKNIKSAFEQPDAAHVITVDELKVKICLRRPKRRIRHLPFIVIADQKKRLEKDYSVAAVLKIPADITVTEDAEPLPILEELSKRYGLPLTIGGKTAHFFVSERLPLLMTGGEFVKVQSPKGRSYTASWYIKAYEAYAEPYLDVTLAFCIADHLYLPAIGK